MERTVRLLQVFFLVICFVVNGTSLFSQTISYIIPDIGAPGSNTYLEIIGPYNTNANFGTDGIYTNNPGDLVQVVCANAADTAKIKFGPVVVSWSGKMISTQVFVLPGVAPNSSNWQMLSQPYRIPIQVLLNGTTYSNTDTFYIVQPQPAIIVSGVGVLGSGGGFGIRSRRGAMIVDSINFQTGASISVSTADCDPGTAGNQGFLPMHILSRGGVTIAAGATISVSAPGVTNPDGGPGGGGGGTESYTNGSACNGGPNPNIAGSGFTGGGTEMKCCTETPGAGTGAVSACLGCGLSSLNGAPGGAGGPICADEDVGAGGTGHPFGTSGTNGITPGGEGGGSGWDAYAGGGFGSSGTSFPAGSEGMVNGNMELIPFSGGSGGCGGVAGPGAFRGGGGGGGGALSIDAFFNFNLLATGQVQSNGGNGVNGHPSYRGGPGGSGGGVIMTGKLSSQGAGTITVAGGAGGVGGAGQGGNGGAGRARVDGPFATFPTITPTPGANSSSSYNGPSTDTISYVPRSFILNGSGNGQPIAIYLKPIAKPWSLVATVTGYTTTWSQNIILPCPDTAFLLTAVQQVATPSVAQYTAEPAWVFSQAAANFLYTTSHFSSAFSADTVCLYNATHFTDLSTGSTGPATQWFWRFGDNTTSTLQNPAHLYAAAGNYTVTLASADTADCPDTISHVIKVNPLPVVNFTVNSVCSNTPPTQFTNTSIATTQWNWNFGDGSNSNLQSPTHAYADSGTYTAVLIATDTNQCADTATNAVIVYPVGVASFTANNVCFPNPVTFNNTSTGPNVAFGWSFGDGQISAQPNPQHQYAAAGAYPVTLIAITANGCGDTVTQTVVINPKPVAGFSAPPVCYGATMLFNDTSWVSTGSMAAYNWDLGDGTSGTAQSPVHVYGAPGNYSVVLAVVTDSGCVDTAINPVVVYQKPVAAFTATTPCIGNPMQFTDASTPAGLVTAFNWAFGDGSVSSLQNPQHAYATAGAYTVQEIIGTSQGCLDTTSQQDTVLGRGGAQFTAPSVCFNDSTLFTNTTTNTVTYPVSTYNWNFGDGTGTSAQTNPANLYGATGNYNVTLIADFTDGCADTATQQISVYLLPLVNDDIIEDSCFGFSDGSIQLSPATGETPYIYVWSNGATAALNASLGPGSYSVTFTDAHQCTASATYNITQPTALKVDTAITQIICFGEDNGAIAVTPDSATPPYSFIWNTGSHAATISNLAPGTYSVTVTDALGCSLTETAALPSTLPYQIQITPVVTINLGDSIQLSPVALNGTAAGWDWTPAVFLSCNTCPGPIARPYTTTLYNIQSTSDKGCVANSAITVEVIPTYNVYIPNVFTPNGDGKNDYFEVYGDKSIWKFFTVQLYDRWGEKVFESSDMNFEWDGTFKGKPLAPSVYVYEIRIVFIDNHTDKLYKGSVTLLR